MTEREGRREFDGTAGDEPGTLPDLPDLSAVQADDALLDALGGSDPQVADALGDQELNALLLAWRRDIDSQPIPELIDTDAAVVTVKTAALAHKHGNRGRKRRLLIPVAAAAAVLTIAFTGTGLAARDAQPGDTLWGLTKVLYADHARSIEAAAQVRSELNAADIAISEGRLDDARKALDDAQAALRQVSVEDNLDQLMAQHRQLSARLDNPVTDAPNNPGTTAPGTSQTGTSPTGAPPPENQPLPPTNIPTTVLPPDNTAPTSDPPEPSTPPTSTTEISSGGGSEPNTGTGGKQGNSVEGEAPAGTP
ncbi:anti-sigma-D factor RsdA [Amycolatopsis magusensis]|uniref:anti-sigma-D factor RsdA n=1 Tax=Amycolatopsis magusensis TaxID=882444 RepID=UPI0037B9D19A